MNERPKRNPKPRMVFIPDVPKQRKPKGMTPNKKEKNRNVALDGNAENKWKAYKDRVKRGLSYLNKEMHNLEVNFEGKSAPERGVNPAHEAARKECEERIFKAKQAIVSTLRAIASENCDHIRWPQLEEGDENDMIDVQDILCSKCNLEEEEDNDILLCDRAGCLRAYHQKCLDPPLDVANIDPDQDWFCWQCECLDDCLDTISERLETEYWKWEDVFPEVNQSLEEALKQQNSDTINNLVLSDDEEDDDYDPSDEGDDNFGLEQDEDREEGDAEVDDDDNEEEREEGSDYDDALHNQDNDDKDSNGEDDEDDDDDDFDGEDNEDDDDDIDEDELKDLLVDAQNDIVYETIASNTRKLRERKPKKEVVTIKLEGKNDVGRRLARVKRGVFELGKIIDYQPSENEPEDISKGEWTIRFGLTSVENDGEDKETKEEGNDENEVENNEKIEDMIFDEDDVRNGLRLYEEYLERIANLNTNGNNSLQQLLESGKLDEANVLDHKRDRKQIDYIQLSLQMFGTLRGDDDSPEEDNNNLDDDLIHHYPKKTKKSSSSSNKKRRSYRDEMDVENGGDNADDYDNPFLEEVDENLDEEWDEGATRKRKKRNSSTSEKRKKRNNKEMGSDEDNSTEKQKRKPRKKRTNSRESDVDESHKKKSKRKKFDGSNENQEEYSENGDPLTHAERDAPKQKKKRKAERTPEYSSDDDVQEVIDLVDY